MSAHSQRLITVGLVVQLMAAALKNLAGQILDTGIAQHRPDFADALAVISNRIAVTGNQQNGQFLVDRLSQTLLLTWFSVASISR